MNAGRLQESVTIRLSHSDAAGVIFFPNAFMLEQESFERWLEGGGILLREMLEGMLAPTPVVHCEADFSCPVRVGDRVVMRLAGVGVGETSFTLAWAMELGGRVAIAVRVRRVSVDPASGRAIGLPERLRTLLAASQAATSTIS
ncbi:MAG: acyl-CoA thioesterase [Phycisphaerales bacterium]|nr:acyl-CoA thioesterase [Phycisphaerales bacterium]